MTRSLHLPESLKDLLHSSQTDAIELACLDCGYQVQSYPGAKLPLGKLKLNSNDMILLTPEILCEAHDEGGYEPNNQTVLVTIEREHPILKNRDNLLDKLNCIMAAQNPGLMRGVLASILEFHVAKRVRGLSSRLIQVHKSSLQKTIVKHSSDRGQIQEEITRFFSDKISENKERLVTGTKNYGKNMGDVVDEFLMNAIWDANPNREFLDRTMATSLEDDEIIDVEYIFDGTNLALSVSDGHGTFPEEAKLKPIKAALGFKEEAQVNEGPGGAGLGLYMILQKVAALSFEIKRGKLTRATAVIRGDQSMRDMQKKPRSLLFFFVD